MAKTTAPEAPHLLVVDDDERLRGLLRRYLADNGFRVTLAADAAEARLKLKSLEYDLAIVDVMMPGENGFALTASLKAERRVPVLLLTAMAEAENRIHGLEQGAEDYLVKPFEPRELVLRIRNILARAAVDSTAAAGEARFGGFRFDLKRAELWRGDESVHLTAA
jgi:two-component system phosphate regulon response regulator OmpR